MGGKKGGRVVRGYSRGFELVIEGGSRGCIFFFFLERLSIEGGMLEGG